MRVICNALLLAVNGFCDFARNMEILAILFPCIAIGAAFLAVLVYFVQRGNRIKMQKRIDERNLLRYRKWHMLVSQTGEMQIVNTPLILSKDERCFWMQSNVTLFEVRSVRHSVHTGGSMPLGKGGLRIGRAYSTSEITDEWRPIASGQLYVTNKQIYFDGDKQDRKIPLNKISTIKAEASSIEVSSDTRQKSMIFMGCNGNICREIVLCALGQELF